VTTSTPAARAIVLLAWAALAAAQVGWLPGLEHAWGLNLWAYHAWPLQVGFAGLSAALCWPELRRLLWRRAADNLRSGPALPGRWQALATFVGVVVVLWVLRERALFGDSGLLFTWARGDDAFVFPDIGATWLLRRAVQDAPLLGLRSASAVALFVCACGGVAFLLLQRLAARLAPEGRPGAAGWILALVVTGGWVRLFAGHFEVYAPLVVAVLVYLVLALERLRGRAPWWAPALAMGVCGWVHAVSILLLPSLLWLLLRDRPGPLDALRRLATAGAVALVPLAVFGAGAFALGAGEDLAAATAKALQVLGRDPDPDAIRWWVRGWGGAPSVGTDVVFFSRGHWKYVLNAGWLLVPFTAPAAVLIGLGRRRGAPPADERSRLLALCALPFLAYAFALRPFWGPWDWDLFSLAAVTGGAWLAHRLAAVLSEDALRDWGSLLVSLQLLLVTLPFLAAGIGVRHEAGPFAPALFELQTARPMTPPGPRLAPWL